MSCKKQQETRAHENRHTHEHTRNTRRKGASTIHKQHTIFTYVQACTKVKCARKGRRREDEDEGVDEDEDKGAPRGSVETKPVVEKGFGCRRGKEKGKKDAKADRLLGFQVPGARLEERLEEGNNVHERGIRTHSFFGISGGETPKRNTHLS